MRISNQTAIHEAGHAVIILVEEREFKEIGLGTTCNVEAMVKDIRCRPDDDEIVRIALAGIMAARLSRRTWRFPFLETATDDIILAAEYLRKCERSEELLDWNIAHTEGQLLNNWEAVLAVAKMFRRKGSVTYSEARDLFESSRRMGREPDGELGADRWKRLAERVRWRIHHPNGIHDLLK